MNYSSHFVIIKNAVCQRMKNEIQPWLPLIWYKVREEGRGERGQSSMGRSYNLC